MGNEMGNNNTSELREEEDNKSTESEGKPKEENNGVSIPENLDCNGRDSEFVVDDDDPKAAIHTNGKESLSEETEVQFSSESPESEKKLIEESSIATEFQITNSLPEQLENCSSPNTWNCEDNVSVTSKDQIGNESSFKKEEEDAMNPSSVAVALARDLEGEDSAGQESKRVEVVQSEQEEKSHELDDHIPDKTEESAAFELAFQENSRPTDERLEVENVDGVVDAEILKENDEDMEVSVPEETKIIATELLNADDVSNSNVNTASNFLLRSDSLKDDISAKVEILQAEEMNSVSQQGIFSPEQSIENGMHCQCQPSEGPISVDPGLINGESEEKGPVKEQTLEIEENTNSLVLTEDQLSITVTKNEGDQIPDVSKPEGNLESCNSELLKTEALHFDVQSTTVPAVELPIEKPDETEAIQFRESETIEGNITLVQEIHSKQESEDSKSLEDKQTLEISEKTEPPEFGEAFKPSFSAFLFHPEDQQKRTAMDSQDARDFNYSITEAAAEVLEILTQTNPSDSENHLLDSCNGSIPEIPIREKEEDGKTLEIEAKSEKPEIDEAYKPSFPASLLHPQDQQQKTATSEVKLESNSQLLEALSSPFFTLMETSSPVIDLQIGKPEEAEAISVQTEESPEFLTETNAENPEDLSTKSCNGSIPEISPGEKQEGEQTLEIKATAEAPEFTEVYKPSFSDSQFRLEDKQQKTAAKCENSQIFDVSTLEILTETNPSGSEKDSTKSCNGPNLDISTDEKLPGSNGESKEQTEKVKALTPDNKEQETTARFSIESNPDSYSSRAEMRKSPSFGPDLRIEAAKTKDSEQTPLLHQNKDTYQEDVNLQTSLLPVEYTRESLKYQPLAPEKSDSKKLKRSSLPEPKQQDSQDSAKEDTGLKVTPKSKDKNRRRSSLFTNCMCCTTVIN